MAEAAGTATRALTREEMRAAIAEQLGTPPAAVGDGDDLLQLGMDSIQVMRLAARWRRAGVDITSAELFERRTLAEWWELARAKPAAPPLAPAGGPAVDENAPFPLATMQRAYWVGRRSDQVLGGVGAQFYCEFDGTEVDPERLDRAVRAVIARHGMLRARFLEDGRQQIMKESPWPGVTVHDLTGLDPAAAEARAEQVRAELSHRRMAAERGEVFDVQLSRLPGGRTRLHLAIDMLVCDAQSFQILLADLADCYARPGAELPPLAYTFPRYLAGQRRRRAEATARDEQWWRERLPDLPGPPQLPLAVDPARLTTRHNVRRSQQWEAEAVAQLAARAREHSVLLSMVFLTAFAEVIGAWSESPRFLLNLPFYDREETHPDVGRIVGDFTNLVLLAVDTSGDLPFVERVRQVQARFHADLAHSSYSGVEVLRDLARARPVAGTAAPVVFTTAINLGELFGEKFRDNFGDPGWTMSTTPQVWLDCQVTQRGSGLFLNWDAVEELFLPGVLDAMFQAFTGALAKLVDGDWSMPLRDLLPASQRAVRVRANATAGPVPDGLLHQGFFTQAAAAPDRVALRWADASTWRYGELATAALRVASLLTRHGVVAGDVVAVTLPRGPEQVAAVLGALAAGAAYVPVGAGQPAARRERILASAGARWALTDAARQGERWPSGVRVLTVAESAQSPPLASPVPVDPDTLAYVIYTSGSTGQPKGVEITHRSALNTVADIGERYRVGPDDRVLAVSALDFDLSVYDLFGLLSAGGSVVLVAEEDRREAARWVESVRRHGVTVWNSVPALLEMALVAGEQRPGWAESLRLALVSGDWVRPELPARLRRQAEGCRFVALGGATEASIWSNAYEVAGDVPPHWTSIPYGWPLRNQAYRVVDARGRDCPDWVPGELWIGGAGVARGYRGDPDRTAAQFVAAGGGRWYRTGDLGRYWPDGTLEFLGRRDTQVKVRGHRIELGEIEAALERDQRVDQAVAVVVEHPAPHLAAVVTPAGPRPDPERLRAHCAEHLPSYMVPEQILVVDSLPLTGNGKVDRRAVVGRFRAVAPAPAAPGAGPPPPVGEVEERLAGLWEELLGAGRVGRTDNFFALGGDSLLATRLMARLRESGLVGGQMRELFARPVLADFATTLRPSAPAGTAPALVADPDHRYDPFPPTEVQRAYWVGRTERFVLGGVGSHWYWEVEGDGVDLTRLERAWNTLVARHEMLRAVFDDDGNQRVQRAVPYYRIGVTEVPEGEAEAALRQMRDDLSARVADPGRWPLVEIRAVRYGRRVRLAFSFDYLVLDALSIIIVFNELSTLYRDPTAELAPLGVSFRDYLLGSTQQVGARAAAERYWRDRAAGLPGPPRLPLAQDPAGLARPRFTRRESILAPARWEEFRALARGHGLSPATALATAYAEVLRAWSAGDEFCLNLTLFDRRDVHPDINRILGDFTSLLLAAYQPGAGESFAAAARRFQARVWADLEHTAVSAVWVLRERFRRTGADPAAPVVFTSALGLPAALVDLELPFGQQIWGLSQTPQVWLDCQVTERGGGLVVTWDAVADLFPPGVLDRMFDDFVAVLDRLAGEDWSVPAATLVPAPPDPVNGRAGSSRDAAGAAVLPANGGFAPPQGEFAPPQGELESALAQMWRKLLGAGRVGRNDNFFTLGGDSLLATQLVESIRQELGVPMSLRQLLRSPTPAELAAAVGRHRDPTGAGLDEGSI